jgi:hypothetical protein
VLVVQAGTCRLYELFDAHHEGAGWRAGSGAVWDLRANRLRPDGWTSADAAGLPILAGLVRYEEVARGHLDHAIRVTVDRSQAAHVWPARHHAGQAGASLPPMGLRLRLRAGVDISGFPSQARVILQAMRTHGLVVADNGSSGFIGGVPDERWDNDALHQLGRITLADLEAVDTAPLRISPASAAARGTGGISAPGARPAAGGAAARRALAGKAAAPALLAGAGRRSLTAEPRVPPDLEGLAALAATAPAPAPAARGPGGATGPALVPQLLAGLLGLIAAALAMRQLVRSRMTRAEARPRSTDRAARSRRPVPRARHVRSKATPAGAPPDRDPTSPRRR